MATLNSELTAFIDSAGNEPTIRIDKQFDPNENAVVFSVAQVRDTPRNWSLIVGELIHDLRGALDMIVWALAVVDSGSEPLDKAGRPVKVQFPICSSKDGDKGFASSLVQKVQLAGLSDAHRTEIASFQPYMGSKGYYRDRHPLAALDDLSNKDKHRGIHPVVFSSGEFQTHIPPQRGRDCQLVSYRQFQMAGRAVYPGAPVLKVFVVPRGPKPDVQVKFGYTFYIAFDDGSDVSFSLEDVICFVTRVLRTLDADLETPTALQTLEAVEASHRPPPVVSLDEPFEFPS